MKTEHLSRRHLLKTTAGLFAGLGLTGSCVSPGRRARAHEGFRIGVCDWTIGKRADPGSFAIAARIGVDGVQVDFGKAQEDLPLFDEALQRRMLAEAEKHKMQIASLAMGVLNGVPYKSDPRAERWLAKAIDVCNSMGTKVIRCSGHRIVARRRRASGDYRAGRLAGGEGLLRSGKFAQGRPRYLRRDPPIGPAYMRVSRQGLRRPVRTGLDRFRAGPGGDRRDRLPWLAGYGRNQDAPGPGAKLSVRSAIPADSLSTEPLGSLCGKQFGKKERVVWFGR